MATQAWKPELVEDEDAPTPEGPVFAELVLDRLLNIKNLSQRAAIAVADCFSLLTVGSVFWLALTIVPYQPTVFQLVGLGGYALFIGIVNIIVRKK